VFGKLAKLTGGMLEPMVKKNIQKLIDGLRWALYVPSPGTVAEGTDSVQVAPAEATPVVEQPTASQELPPAGAQEGTLTSCLNSKAETTN